MTMVTYQHMKIALLISSLLLTVPWMPGVVSGDAGFMDDNEGSFREMSNSSQQLFNILCSGDKDGSICISIFGIFPIGKINIHKFFFPTPLVEIQASYRLLNASIYKAELEAAKSEIQMWHSSFQNESPAGTSFG